MYSNHTRTKTLMVASNMHIIDMNKSSYDKQEIVFCGESWTMQCMVIIIFF
jgi:hypothetical protein